MALILSGDTGPSFVQSSALPASSVVQVVEISTATQTESVSSSFADTGLVGSITPSSASNRIVVSFASSVLCGSNSEMGLQLVRNSTVIAGAYKFINSAGTIWTSAGGIIYDSPATTSSTTYKIQIRRINGSNSVYFGTGETPTVSRMILMEIKV
jgi:hypothetical protein